MKHQRENSTVYNMDCLEYMKTIPDKYYSLALVDPPYGIGFGEFNRTNKDASGNRHKANKYKNSNWDDCVPSEEYFKELMRISKEQIIWGGNYFTLPPTRGFIFWHKKNPVPNFSDGEFAWASFNKVAKCFNYAYYGNINTDPDRIHPTQKPIALYDWIYKNYLPNGGKVIDTHLGSQSNRISAFKRGNIIFDACELDVDYFNDGNDRYDEFLMKYQPAELNPITKQGQHKLF